MKKLSLIILALLAVLASCKKAPEVNLKYVDVEREVLTVGTTTATFQCDYQYISTLKSAKIYYGLSESGMSSKEMQVVSSSLYAEITGLASSTAYNYYYEFDNGYNTMNSGTKSFVTEASATVVLPTVITADVTDITAESAVSGGNVTNDGGGTVTARGICWSLSLNPTINDSLTTGGDGIGSFISNMTGLSSNTTYHVRAYATNEAGTAYGLDKEFTTPVLVPEGAINGLFTINENGDKVYFSKGNLQYQASTNSWRFADNQWDYVGSGEYGNVYENSIKCDNVLISETYDGWIDLFGWGASGWNNGNLYYQPFDYQLGNQDIAYGYGPTDGTNYDFDLTGDYANSDWGVYNSIVNGGNTADLWRTLIHDEWYYLLFRRTTLSGNRFAKASINGSNGVVLLPDDWHTAVYTFNSPNSPDASYYTNEITTEEWIDIETNGAVFLPAAGYRHITTTYGSGNYYGRYWSSESSHNISSGTAYIIDFFENEMVTGWFFRYGGLSVRLVQDVK